MNTIISFSTTNETLDGLKWEAIILTVKKKSGSLDYEKKLTRVMERFGIKEKEFNFNYDRQGFAWVEFKYKGKFYRFDHSVEKAKSKGITLKDGRDAFKVIVLTLEDLARMSERGTYELQTWVEGLKFLPAAAEIPSFLKYLKFDHIPQSEDEIKDRYKEIAKLMHPDAGGNPDDFIMLQEARDKAIQYVGGQK